MNKTWNHSMAKVIMLGDSSVGKTSIVYQLFQQAFREQSEATIGASYISQQFKTPKGPITLHIWDTAGQERFRSIIPMYSRGCSAAVLVYSIESQDTFQNIGTWIELLHESGEKNCKIYIVANKIDLGESKLVDMGRTFSEENGYAFFITSAKDYNSVFPVFQRVADDLAESEDAKDIRPTNSFLSREEENNNRSGCC